MTIATTPPSFSDLVRLLADTGAIVNIVFHKILLARADVDERFSVERPAFDTIVDWLRTTGLAAYTRIYFDDNHESSHHTVASSDLTGLAEIVIAVPAATIGHPETGDLAALHRSQSSGVRIAAHGYEHVRLASYDSGGALLTTPAGGPYAPASPTTTAAPLTENQVLYQLVQSAEALAAFAPSEFVLPYGCFNATTVALNERFGLFAHLATADFDLDVGQELRPRLLIEAGTTPELLEARLLHRIGADR